NVTDNHQEHNARALADKGAAIIMKEEDLDYFTLYQQIEALKNDSETLNSMRRVAKAMAENDATNIIVKTIAKLK
ncbi:MAG: undecaprenyldiphospho-muramoylpentapeptide beta-N-acetylglucosaminyltransferase, partial [Clostridia bacterium]|nr:undecaprenyldiphospho-muramoylpentapeptide beta-N-acetylglucosaminyltransferase [Clostridia bacterium]